MKTRRRIAEPDLHLNKRQPTRAALNRILLADDHLIMRRGIVANLKGQREMTVAAEGSDGDEAVALIKRHRPDAVLLDLRMPRTDELNSSNSGRLLA